MGTRTRADQLDSELVDAMGELIVQLIARGEQIAQRFGVPVFCLKALHVLDSAMAMRDLGRQMHCDPSFVTAIADLLEKRGLARREASTADRRIKNLVLTQEGVGLRGKLEREFISGMPWRNALDQDERACLLGLIRKMISAGSGAASAAGGSAASAAASSAMSTAASGATPVAASSPTSPATPPTTGGEGAGEVSETLITAQPAG